jgi:hypothetical protein
MPEYDHSIADVLKRSLNDAQDLMRSEIALAKAEMREEVRRVGGGVVLLASAAVAGLLGVMVLLMAGAWAISTLLAWPVWAGFAMVAVTVLVIAAVLGGRPEPPDGPAAHAPDDGNDEGEHGMDASPDVLAEQIRAKRAAIDNDLELLRVRLKRPIRGRSTRSDGRVWPCPWRPAGVRVAHRASAAPDQIARPPAGGRALRAVRGGARAAASARAHARTRDEPGPRAGVPPAPPRDRGAGRSPAARVPVDAGEAAVHRCGGRHPAHRRRRREDGAKGIRAADLVDAALVATAQRIEHVEIAMYGTLRTYAETLGYTYAAQLLQQTLEEERAADEALTRLAERFINPHAVRTAQLA